MYSADQVERGKPHPDLFLFAAANNSAPTSRCVVIEDSANGIRAAKAAGMYALGLTAGGHCGLRHGQMLAAAGADLVLDHWHQVPAALKEFGN